MVTAGVLTSFLVSGTAFGFLPLRMVSLYELFVQAVYQIHEILLYSRFAQVFLNPEWMLSSVECFFSIYEMTRGCSL